MHSDEGGDKLYQCATLGISEPNPVWSFPMHTGCCDSRWCWCHPVTSSNFLHPVECSCCSVCVVTCSMISRQVQRGWEDWPFAWFSMAKGFSCKLFFTFLPRLLKNLLFSAASVRYSGEALSSALNLQHCGVVRNTPHRDCSTAWQSGELSQIHCSQIDPTALCCHKPDTVPP